jgi:hypothetical protein
MQRSPPPTSTTSRQPIRCRSSRAATYVFDLGYYDYLWWATLDAAGCQIFTRLKSNTPLNVIEELAVIPGRNILSDRIGFLPARQAGRRSNPMQETMREVRIIADTVKLLRILSNGLDASAEEITHRPQPSRAETQTTDSFVYCTCRTVSSSSVCLIHLLGLTCHRQDGQCGKANPNDYCYTPKECTTVLSIRVFFNGERVT